MNDIGEITNQVVDIYTMRNEKNNIDRLLELIEQNHSRLKELGVSCKEIEDIVAIAKGIYSCKLTGAGAGGCVIGLRNIGQCDDQNLKKELEKKGYTIHEGIEIAEKGMKYAIDVQSGSSKL